MKNFIQKLLMKCNNINIIIGTRNQNEFSKLTNAQIIQLKSINEIESIKLFYKFAENYFG